MPQNPLIHKVSTIAETRIFRIEAVDLEFSNGVRCQFERINKPSLGAVMVIPIVDDTVVLIREYAVGSEQYELGFVKGLIDLGETPEQAANRELKEEISFASNAIQQIRKIRLIPHYNSAVSYLMLAEDLYPQTAAGDEPEKMEQIRWPLNDINRLLAHDGISDVRTLHALYWLRDHINTNLKYAI